MPRLRVDGRWLTGDQAERMTNRIAVNAEVSVLRGLMLVNTCPRSDHRRLRRSDVWDREVEVQLLRVGAPRPRRLNPVVYPLKGERRASFGVVRAHPAAGWHEGSEVRVGPFFQLPAEDVGVEATERQRVGAVQDDKVELRRVLNCIAHDHTVVPRTEPSAVSPELIVNNFPSWGCVAWGSGYGPS